VFTLVFYQKLDESSCNSASDDDEDSKEGETEEKNGDDDDEEEAAEGSAEDQNPATNEKNNELHPKEDTESIGNTNCFVCVGSHLSSFISGFHLLRNLLAGSNEAGPSSAKEIDDKSALEQEDEDDPTNLQLAWESVELAKAIFVKHLESLPENSPLRDDVVKI